MERSAPRTEIRSGAALPTLRGSDLQISSSPCQIPGAFLPLFFAGGKHIQGNLIWEAAILRVFLISITKKQIIDLLRSTCMFF